MKHDCVLIMRAEVHQKLADVKDEFTSSQHKRGHKIKYNPPYFIASEERKSQQLRKIEMRLAPSDKLKHTIPTTKSIELKGKINLSMKADQHWGRGSALYTSYVGPNVSYGDFFLTICRHMVTFTVSRLLYDMISHHSS